MLSRVSASSFKRLPILSFWFEDGGGLWGGRYIYVFWILFLWAGFGLVRWMDERAGWLVQALESGNECFDSVSGSEYVRA